MTIGAGLRGRPAPGRRPPWPELDLWQVSGTGPHVSTIPNSGTGAVMVSHWHGSVLVSSVIGSIPRISPHPHRVSPVPATEALWAWGWAPAHGAHPAAAGWPRSAGVVRWWSWGGVLLAKGKKSVGLNTAVSAVSRGVTLHSPAGLADTAGVSYTRQIHIGYRSDTAETADTARMTCRKGA